MHGRLHSDDKDAIMREFSDGKIDVLVSTTVVEVGVNVPNATFMLIYDASTFWSRPAPSTTEEGSVGVLSSRIVSYSLIQRQKKEKNVCKR